MPFTHRIEHASRREIHAAASAQIADLESQIAALSESLTRAHDQGITRRALRVTLRQVKARLTGAVQEAITDARTAARWSLSGLAIR